MKLKQILAAALILVISVFSSSTAFQAQDGQQYRLAHANGEGNVKVGQEQFKLNAIVVKLLNDRTAEITLVADITIFLTGTWSQNGESQETFDLEMKEGSSRGGLEGGGKLTLGKDSKDVRLVLKGKSRATKRNVEVYFVGK